MEPSVRETKVDPELAHPVVALAADRRRRLSAQSLTVPLIVAIQGRQSRLIVDDILESTRAAIVAASQVVANRGIATNDAFLRYHLSAAAFEIARMSASLESLNARYDAGAPCLIQILDQELSRVSSILPRGALRISREITSPGIVPSWSAAWIFGRLLRIILEDAAKTISEQPSLCVRLKRSGELLRFEIEGPGHYDATAFMCRIPSPGRFRSLLSTLSGRISAAPNGISLNLPVIACTNFEDFEVTGHATPCES